MSGQDFRQIGKYTVQGVLGEGAMGRVYKGLDEDLQRVVAIKTIHNHLLVERDRATFLARFRQEARIASRCMHPNVVTLFEFGLHEEMPFIAMEYVEGEELLSYMQEGVPFDFARTVRVIGQLLSALDHAHGHGVVHRDIKPANIFMMKDGRIKLGDFGIAKVDTSQLTQKGVMIGSPGYMAPEQFLDGLIDARTDLFATGVVLFELLTGTKPFPGKTAIATMRRVLDEPPPVPSEVNRRLPKGLDAIIKKALSNDAEQRFASARAFSLALRQALTGNRSHQASPVAHHQPQTKPAQPLPPKSPPGMQASHTEQGWNPSVLEQAEKDLVEHIGPLAKVLVARAARDSSTIHDLYSTLAESVGEPSSQTLFRSQGDNLVRTYTGQTPIPSNVKTRSVATHKGTFSGLELALTPERLQQIEQALTEYLGPIARVLVKKEAKQASSVVALCRQLLEFIPTQAERDAFSKKRYK